MTVATWIIAICILLATLYRANVVFLEWMAARYRYNKAPKWVRKWASITTGVRS